MNKRLLCVTTGFDATGAPIALYRLLKVLSVSKQYDIHVVGFETGEMISDYAALLGTSSIEILNELPYAEKQRNRFRSDYDVILLNTAVVCDFYNFFQNLSIPVYWWIHEAPAMIMKECPGFPDPHYLSSNFHLLTSSAGASSLFSDHYSFDAPDLPVPVFYPEKPLPEIPIDIPDDIVLFVIPSAYTYIKGQDILLHAIKSLPDDYRSKAIFLFFGYTLPKEEDYKNRLIQLADTLDNVILLDALPQIDAYALMNKADCIIAPSRIDTIPLTVVEGMMFNKLVLVSSNTGISSYITDCVNGFVFSDHDELIKRLLLIISDRNNLKRISDGGHNIYSEFFSPDSVSKRCSELGIL